MTAVVISHSVFIYQIVLLQRQILVFLHQVSCKIELERDNENYRVANYKTQTAKMKCANKNYTNEEYTK